MKLKTYILIMSFMALNAAAEIKQDVKVPLQYTDDRISHDSKSHNSYLDIEVESVVYREGNQKEKLKKAFILIDEIVNSVEFKTKVISYMGKKGVQAYSKNYLWSNSKERLSNEDIYDLIMKGDEKMVPDTIGKMNLNVRRYWSSWWGRRTIGYTSPGSSKRINVNGRHYKGFEVNQMVGNIVHEWIHLLGFLHGKSNIHEEVPYVVGQIANEMALDILRN
jgi:hypothetical protein